MTLNASQPAGMRFCCNKPAFSSFCGFSPGVFDYSAGTGSRLCAGEVPPVRIHTCLSKCFADREERRGHLLQPTRQEQGGDNGVMAAAVGEGLGQLWSSQGKNGDGAAEDWTWRKDLSIASHCCQLSDNMHE